MRLFKIFPLLLISLLFVSQLSLNAQAVSDPPSIPVFRAAGPITLDGQLLEPDWAFDKPHMMFRVDGAASGNSNTPTAYAIVKPDYTDTSTCYVKFLRDGFDLYFALSSNDKQVCRFDWEGDGMFMKFQNAAAEDKEYKIYVGIPGGVPAFVFETNGPANSGDGVGFPLPGTTIYDSSDVDNGYTAEMVIHLNELGFATPPTTVTLMINIFDPDNYSLGVPPWGPNGNFAKQWWGSEWGGTYRTLQLLNEFVPVELTSFTAAYVGNSAQLEWITATETNNNGFEIQRSINNSSFSVIGFVEGKGTTSLQQKYQFTDQYITPGNSYSYRLKQIDFSGEFSYSNVVDLGETTPVNFELFQNYPNPFNPTTNITIALPEAASVNLDVYNLLGQKVKTLLSDKLEAGRHTVVFDAASLSAGIYIYKLSSVGENGNRFVSSKKMTLLK